MQAPFLPNATGYSLFCCRFGCSGVRDGRYNAARVNRRVMLPAQAGQKHYQPFAVSGYKSMQSGACLCFSGLDAAMPARGQGPGMPVLGRR